jgi:hypothetical protein
VTAADTRVSARLRALRIELDRLDAVVSQDPGLSERYGFRLGVVRMVLDDLEHDIEQETHR